MARSNNQKAKILYLERMLRETGENRAISMQEILENLLEKGIRAERKSIYDDMEVLREFGMNIQYRREKPSGYYLEGQKAPEEAGAEATVKAEAKCTEEEPAAQEAPEPEIRQKTDQELWKKAPEEAAGAKKQIRILCSGAAMEEVRAYFGADAEYKEKENGDYLVTASVAEGKNFYGWLTAMGRTVHLMKPKKTAQAYREYLKALAKEYK